MIFRGPRIAAGASCALHVAWLLLGAVGCRAEAAQTSAAAEARSRAPVAKVTPVPIQQVGWLTIGLNDPPAQSLMEVKPPDLPAHLKSLYRLRPDRRFLYAAAEVDRLMRGGPRKGTMSVRFQEGRWMIDLDAASIGSMPALPTFADAKTFLASRVPAEKRAPGSHPPEAGQISDSGALDNAEGMDLMTALAGLNSEWAKSPGNSAIAEKGLRGLLWLALQTYDEVNAADPILGKAMALLAIAEAGNPGRLAREECLLAALLGYEEEARKLAAALPAEEPVRLFAEWNIKGLAALVYKTPGEPRAEYLYLLRLAGAGAPQDLWIAALKHSSWEHRSNIPTLRLLLESDSFDLRTMPAERMERRLLEEFHILGPDTAPTDKESTPESRCAAFEAAVEKAAARLEGPILDGESVRAFFLANFYSSIAAQTRFYFDKFGSTEEAERLAKSIENPPPGTATELKEMILHRVQLRRSVEGARAVSEDLGRFSHVGGRALSRLVYTVAAAGTASMELKRMSVPALFGHLDSRPYELDVAARACRDLLNDLSLVEEYFREAARRGPRQTGTDLPWALGFLGDDQGLRALARDKSWPFYIRVSALEEIARRENRKGSKELVADFQALVREDPSNSTVLRKLVDLLETRNELEPAQRLVEAWLKRHPDNDLEWAGMMAVKTRLLRKQGRLQEAWKIGQAAAGTWKWECMQEASLVLIELGRLEDALAMAGNQLRRYGHDDDRAFVAQILWMKGQDDEASQLLTSPERRLSSGAWSTPVAKAFATAFKKSDEIRAEAAFLKLLDPSVPVINLIYFVEHLTNHERPELAMRLAEHLRGRGSPGWGTYAVYHATRKARGREAGREWLRANATPVDLDVIGKQALVERDFECVLDLPDHPDPTKNEILNLIRAAAIVHGSDAQPERREQLIHFLESRPRSDFVSYGLFLLGRADRAELFGKIKDTSDITSIGWLIGLASAQQGRYEEANSWLQVCMEAGADNPPRIWASTILGSWKAEGGTLQESASKKIY